MPNPVLPPLPNAPSSGFLVTFSPAQWTWIVQAFQTIHTDNEAVAEALGPLTQSLEGLLQAMSALTDEVAALKTNVADLATRISSEISDLAAAVAALGSVSPEVTDAIAAIHATNAQLVALSGSLTADDQPAPPSA